MISKTPANGCQSRGYTLIELVIVIFLIGLMVVVVVPNISSMLQTPSEDAAVQWLTGQVAMLKKAAVKDKIVYELHADTSENSFWITSESMEDQLVSEARNNRYRLPWGASIENILFPEDLFAADSDDGPVIRFYPEGYSDPAMIRLVAGGRTRTVEIRSLLPDVAVHDGSASYDA